MNPTNDERARFEEAMAGQNFGASFERRADGEYLYSNTEFAWRAWLARSQSAPAAQGEATPFGFYHVHLSIGDPESAPEYDVIFVHGDMPPDDRPCWKPLYTTPQPSAPGVVSDAMVEAYLQANTTYWQKADELQRPIGKWRTGTPQEATREGLQAALAAAVAQPSADDSPRVPSREWLESKLRIDEAAEARGESTDCTVRTPSAMPSCLCCGHRGVAKCWHAERPEIYVCTTCHAKATAGASANARAIGHVDTEQLKEFLSGAVRRLTLRHDESGSTTAIYATTPADARDADDTKRMNFVEQYLFGASPVRRASGLLRFFPRARGYPTLNGATLRDAIDRAMGGES